MVFAPALLDLAVVLAVAATIGFLFQKMKQPAVMGYILAGVLIGPNSPIAFLQFDLPSIHFWADLGIIFLMFYLGLEFSFRRMFQSGLKALFIGGVEITLLFLAGSAVAQFFLKGIVQPAYLGAMVAISSTTIIIKALDDLPAKERRSTEKVYPLLIIEDLAAVLLIVVLSSSSAGREINDSHLLFLAAELLIVIGGWYLIGSFLLPRMVRTFETKRELLTLVSVALCLLIAVGAAALGYSLALGAFITGSVLAEMDDPERIQKTVRPLKDLFGAVFFASVGMLVSPLVLMTHFPLILGLALFVIAGKAVAVTIASLSAGETYAQSLRSGLAMGQVGEFSFIIAQMGLGAGLVQAEFQPVIVAVALVTAFTTPYAIRFTPTIVARTEKRIPERARIFGRRYRHRLYSAFGSGRLPEWMRSATLKFALNTILITLIFGSARRHFVPWFADRALQGNERLAQVLTLAAAFLLCAPLLLAMFTCGKGARRSYFFPMLTLVWIAFLGSLFVEAWISVVLSLALCGLLLNTFSQNLAKSYAWLEDRFLAGFKPVAADVGLLAPWNAHLSRLRVHPNAKLAGRALGESNLRRDFGLSLLALRRGDRLIAVPEKDERLMPFDELLLLGNDDQVENARPAVEFGRRRDEEASFGTHDLDNFEMRHFRLGPESSLVSQRIRDTHLRDETGEWIVGVERGSEKVLSPPPEFELREGDVVWTVGPRL